MDPRLEFAVLTGRVATNVVRERLSPPRPTTLREVPPGPDHVTHEWLERALCDGVPGAKIAAFDFGARDDGATARCPLHVTYNDAGRAADLPEDLFTKSGPTFTTRLMSAAVNLSAVEAAFYMEIRPELDIEAPRGAYAAYDPVTERNFLIIEDVSKTRGATFGSALDRKLTRAQAEDLIDVLATLHAQYWEAPLERRFGSWMRTSAEWLEMIDVTLRAEKRIAVGCERAREVMPPEIYARRGEIYGALERSVKANVTGPQTLLHTDVHPGNWYVTGDGRMGLYDWACMVRGGWARDVAYALSMHLTIEDRRAWEHDLLARHRERLAERGIEPPDPDDALRQYSHQICHGLLMWIATLGLGKIQGEAQPKEISLENIQRCTQAAADLGTLDV